MLERLMQEAARHGDRLAAISAARLPDVKQDFDARGIDTAPYHDFTPRVDAGFDVNSILVVASPSPPTSVSFDVDGAKTSAAIPPTFAGFKQKGAHIRTYLSEFLAREGFHITLEKNLPCKPIAVHAGLGVLGRNNIVYVEGMGSLACLYLFVSDVACDYERFYPLRRMDACATCARCVAACPTAALTRDRDLIDADRCLTMFNEHAGVFPDWLEGKHNALVGCTQCQCVCPQNNWKPADEIASYDRDDTLAFLRGEQEAVSRLGFGYGKLLPRNLAALIKRGIPLLLTLALLLLSACAPPAADDPPAVVTPPTLVSTPSTVETPAEDTLSLGSFDTFWSRVDGSTATIPLSEAIFDRWNEYGYPIVHNMTSHAYDRLLRGEADLIFVTYPSEGELADAAEKGIALEIIPVVKDAFVFLVNTENPVESLTLRQYRDIYTGVLTNWKQVGGTDAAILPYQRPVNSGSQTLFLKLVMNGAEPMEAPREWRPAGMGSLVDLVSAYDNAQNSLGYSVFYFVSDMYGNEHFKLLGVDNVKPTRESIAAGDYPLETFYYAVLRKDTPPDSPARALVDWLLTDDGQRLAQGAGYVPLRPVAGDKSQSDLPVAFWGDTTYSSGTGGTVRKTEAEIEAAFDRPMSLSDFFYDGVNYIAYINEEIARQLDQPLGWDDTTQLDTRVLRPFTGIPNGYRYVQLLWTGELNVLFLAGNPFFRVGENSSGTAFRISLPPALSPYGTEFVKVSYAEAESAAANITLMGLSVVIPQNDDAAARINSNLREWIPTVTRMPEASSLVRGLAAWLAGAEAIPPEAVGDFVYHLLPEWTVWNGYLSVNYYITARDGPSSSYPLLSARVYDIDTGEVVNLADKLTGQNWACGIWYETTFGVDQLIREPFELPEGVTPEAYLTQVGAVLDCTWVDYINPYSRYRLPDGRALILQYWEKEP